MAAEKLMTPRMVLAEFRENHPDLCSVKEIVEFGNEAKFVHQYGPTLAGGNREARIIYRSAKNLQEQAALLWSNIREATSPYFSQTLFNNLPQDLPQRFIEQQSSIPGYDRIFGNLDFIDCDHYRSIFGPAAYFVDLMRFVEQNITTQLTQLPLGSNLSLEDRRPDLARIRLDADNTSDLVPYIDLVNELLETFVKTVEAADADIYEIVKDEIFPMSLPLHLPLDEIRIYLKQLKVSLHQIYELFQPSDQNNNGARTNPVLSRAIVQSLLSLSAEEFSLIVTEASEGTRTSEDEPAVFNHYGEVALSGAEGLENVDVFLAQTNLTRKELDELIFQDLDRHEINAGLSRLFFINNVDDGMGYLEIFPDTPVPRSVAAASSPTIFYDRLLNLSPLKLDRIHRFLRLARKLDWSFVELDQVLRSLHPSPIAERALRFDGRGDRVTYHAANELASDLTEQFTIEAWISPEAISKPGSKRVILSKGDIASQQLHFMLWVDEANRLTFYGNRQPDADTSADPFQMQSVYTLPTDEFSHVAVVVSQTTVRFYINGSVDQGDTLSGGSIASVGADFTIGGGLVAGAFAGVIKDVRLWTGALSLEEIAAGRYRRQFAQPNEEDMSLLAYWPLVETVDGWLYDHSGNGHHAQLGGEQLVSEPRWVRRDLLLDPLPPKAETVVSAQAYRPQRMDAPEPSFSQPLRSPERNVLRLDGDNDVVVIKNQKNWGLGRLDRWTLEFWFKATGPQLRDRKQLLFSQGDREAGISIYLYEDKLHVFQWCDPLNRNNFQSFRLMSPTDVTYNTWHHFALMHNEFPEVSATEPGHPVETIEFRAMLNETPLENNDAQEDEDRLAATGVRLSPVGVMCLGGLARSEITRFAAQDISTDIFQDISQDIFQDISTGENTLSDEEISYFFAGEVADFRLWQTVKSPEAVRAGRGVVPAIMPDLLAYLPLDEADGWMLSDRAGAQHQNLYRGTLQRREIILQTDQRGRALANIYAHYVKEGAVISEGIPTEGDLTVAPGPERVVTEGVVTEDVVTEGGITESVVTTGSGTEGIGTEATKGLVTEGATTLTTGLGSLQWTNYFYAGRFRMTDERASVGVTFLSRHPEKVDQYYRLGRKPGQPFVLSAHPSGVQTVKSADPEQDQRLTDITPVSNVWYHFLVRVENEEDRTVIQAKVWQEGEVEPADFQINAYDDNPDIRITSGTVGLWSQGQSQGIRQFDNLRVWPISVAAPTPADLLLDINFEAPSQIPEPEMWQDSGDRITPLATRQGENGQAPEPLFKLINIDGAQSVFGTESTLNNIHAHYTNADADVLSWQNYTFSGQLQITQKGSAIGVTFLSRYPETLAQEDNRPTHQYYSLRRDAQHPTFYLMAVPESVQSVMSLNPQQTPSPGQLDSGVEPEINTWYRFSISVVDNQREQRTDIRAKVWKASEPEPEAYQIVAHDSSSIRLRTGTVGVWTSGRGAKYFDRLVVAQDVLLSERFESYAADQDPKDWFDTNQRNSAEEDNSLFKTAEVAVADQSTLAFGTRSNRVNIHTHYIGEGALAWKNYVYTGRLLTTDEKASLGLTFLSRYSNESDESGLHDVYYRLRSSARNSTFHIAPHPQTNDYDIKGQTDSTIRPQPNTWYRFRIEVEDTGTQTNIRANVWPEGEPEPTNFQIDAYDDSESRLTEGTVGLWTAQQGGGSHGKYFDDLLVTHGFLLSTTIRPDLWSDAPARDRFILRPDFFTAIDAQDNPLQLVSSDTLPLRNPPLSKKALAFDGKQQYLASKLTPEQSFSDITLEAWIHPDFDNASSTLISLMGRKGEAIADADNSVDDGENNLLEWGLDESNQLTLTVMGQTFTSNLPLSTIEFTHVALRIEGVRVTFIVNGDSTPFATAESPPAETPPAETLLDAEISAEATPAETPSTENGLLSQPLSIIVTNLILARDQSATKYFKGKINDIRIWTVVRTSEQISIGRQQQPDVRAAELLGYWQLGERWPQERSLQGARSFAVPNLAKPDQATRVEATLTPGLPPVPQAPIGIELSDSGFWRSQRPVMMLNGSQSVQFVDEQPPEDRQQQTIEVWFQVTDKNISARKQVIYHEGNGQQGLVLYVYDGELYFVGYNLPAAGEAATESQWPIDYAENWWINPADLRRVWRLKSNRIESGRWHHTAIVLDGRDEVRPESLRGYIDGKLAVVGPGSKLWQHQRSFRIGQANAERVQFHDGPADGAAHRLQGGILQVRLWNSARTSQQIAENWSTDILETGIDRNNLMLMWDFAAVTEMQIPDGSGNGRVGQLTRADQLKTLRDSLQNIPAYQLHALTLDESALAKIADIKRLKETRNLPVERLSALWSTLKHTGKGGGKGGGKARRPLFDRVFNPEEVGTDAWRYHLDRPIRWDRTGRENLNRDRQIRARLMESLRVSSQDLDVLTNYLSGGELIVELDTAYLETLYRLSQLPKLLKLTVAETLVLLALEGHPMPESLEAVLALSQRAERLADVNLTVAELVFLGRAVETDHADLYSQNAVRDLIKAIASQLGNLLINGESFVTTEVTEAQSLNIFQFLRENGTLAVINAVELATLSPVQQQVQAIAAVVPDASLSAVAQADKTIDLTGLIDHLASTENWSQTQRENLSEPILTMVQETLMRHRVALSESILQGLADMFEVSADLVDVVVSYLSKPLTGMAGGIAESRSEAMDAIAFIRQIYGLNAAEDPIPLNLSIYLAKLVKLLFLLAKYELSVKESRAFLNRPEIIFAPTPPAETLVIKDLFQPTWENLERLAYVQKLKAAYKDEVGQLFEILGNLNLSGAVANDPQIVALAALTAWEPRQLITLAQALNTSEHGRVEALYRLHQGFAIAQLLGSDVDSLIQLASTQQLDFAFYREQADILFKILRSRYDDATWANVYKPIKNELALKRRDALLAMAMKKLPDSLKSRKDPDILYEYFLMDMQVGSEVEVSRIVQATASLQLYVQRCLMNLEAGVNPDTISQEEWEWVKNYRVWEANRKVFLYPENYIEPELRRTKTPLFEELEQQLLQTNITEEAVERVYVNYLDQFAEVAKLKIVGSYLHRDLAGDPNPGDETLYLVGRTNTQPRIYYIRRHVKNKKGARWLPWEKIDLAINSDFATPVYAFGKLLLFWTEFTKLKRSEGRSLGYQIRQYSVDFLKALLGDLSANAKAEKPLDINTVEGLAAVFKGPDSEKGIVSYQKYQAFQLLKAELASEELERLVRAEWTIDRAYYLFDNRIVGRVQKTVDFYQAAVKYSYYNFGNHWIPAQTNSESEIDITQYRDAKWHSLYAQRVFDFRPQVDSRPPVLASNRRVLKAEDNTQIAVLLPRFNMETLTWSLWVKFTGSAPQRYKGSLATNTQSPLKNRKIITAADLRQSLTLLNYDHGRFQVAVTNNVTAIPDAQAQEDRVKAAIPLTARALAAAERGDFRAVAAELAKISPALPALINAIAQAQTATNTAITAENEATETRNAANANPSDPRFAIAVKEWDTRRDSAQIAARNAINAANKAAEAQLRIEVETMKWQVNTLSLTVTLGNETFLASTALPTGSWQHLAVTLEYGIQAQGSGYTAEVSLHQENGTALPVSSKKFMKANKLTLESLLAIAGQDAASRAFRDRKADLKLTQDIFSTQLAEVQLHSEIREFATTPERLQRQNNDVGVFILPLNELLPSSIMSFVDLADGELALTEPIAFKGELPGRLTEDRERIIIFYGDKIKSIRNNLEDQGFNLTLDRTDKTEQYDVRLKSYQPSGKPKQAVLSQTKTKGLFLNDFATVDDSIVAASFLEAETGPGILISQMQSEDVSFFDVHNRPGWHVIDTGDDQFLIKSLFYDRQGNEMPVSTAAELIKARFDDRANTIKSSPQSVSVSFDLPADQAPAEAAVSVVEFELERLNTYAIHQLSQRLFTGGIDAFLSLEAQQTQELDFSQYLPTIGKIRNPMPPGTIDFQGNYRHYYEEVFFHIPFLIANQLNQNQQFADAQKWYHYIFNPTAPKDGTNPATENDRYWRYLPFKSQGADSLQQILTNEEALTVYREDPADPHAIAALRLTTYQKAIVMKYIDNLLDWGDSLFAQDTRESITEATMLYVLAFNLLGPKPTGKTKRQIEDIGTYNDFSADHNSASEFLTEVEKRLPVSGSGVGEAEVISLSPHSRLLTHFCVPENEKFIGYWDRVQDRLYKIRHSLNIEGIFRQLALFQPPIDPADLVRAAASGLGIGGGLANLNVSVPHYRYSAVLEQAKEVTSMVIDLGSALLSALEAKEDGQLTLLQHTHERNLLNLITTVKEFELTEAKEALKALKISRENVEARKEYYRGLVEDGTAGLSLNAAEGFAITANTIIRGLKPGVHIANAFAKAAEAIPEFQVGANGFGGSPVVVTSLDGENIGALFEAQGIIVAATADILDIGASLSEEIGAYQRRYEEWSQEKKIAEIDLREIDQQIEIATIHIQRTEFEYDIHEKEKEQNQEVADFYRSKFTNGELRNWLAGRLSGLYFQAYKLAYDLAKGAEKSLQYELPTTQTFISPSHWDSLKKGLLAGESLLLELNQMDKVRLDQDSRFQEIEKTISMQRTFPDAFNTLRETGLCELSLGERLFNQDFPGHYCRLIKTIAISVETQGQIDPYDSVHATLNQTGNKTLLVPDSSAVNYLMTGEGDAPDTSTLRVNWRTNQQIAISKPDKDLGMFVLNFFRDDRYFPFEGTGAVSTWQLEMPLETNLSLVEKKRLDITDVIIHLRYTSKFDQGAFKKAVQEMMR